MDLIINGCGCLVEVNYDYDPITDALIEAYGLNNTPQTERIYKAWDAAVRALKGYVMEPYKYRFVVDDNGSGEAVTSYTIPILQDSIILGVDIEGQGIDETDPVKVSINTVTGVVSFGMGLIPGQFVKIDYKKAKT